MQLPEISIRRPVLATMLSSALVVFGLVGLSRLPVRELPDIDPPVVTVLTVYPGANASVVETEVTEPLEDAVNGVQGIKKMTSESREQVSSITVEFTLDRPIDLAAQDVRDRVSRVRGRLPKDIEDPVVSKQDSDARPVIWVALYSGRHGPLELTEIAENTLKERLQTVDGVSSVIIGGARRFAVRLRLDSERMAARGVTVLDVSRALTEQNVELPSGRVENLQREMTIETRAEFQNPKAFEDLVLRRDGDALVRLGDVGSAEAGSEDERTVARYNGKEAVGLGIVRQSKANTIAVARGVKAELARLRPLLPEGLETFMAYDESVFVEKAITEVWWTLGIAFILVVLTIYLFLGDVRTTLIPALSIPVSLVSIFSVLMWMGYSINILTMLGLILAIGMVVDDSIVVLENIYRHIEEGAPPMEAAFAAMGEIKFAVIATTVALVAVFVPLMFQTSLTGRLFIEFAVTLCGAVIISTFVALSLTPMVCSRLLRPASEKRITRMDAIRERFLGGLTERYLRGLGWALGHKKTVLAIGALAVAAGGLCCAALEEEFLPDEDKGRLFAMAITPEGSTAEYTDRMVRKMESIISEVPERAGFFSAVALAMGGPGKSNLGMMFVRFKEDRERRVQDILAGPRGVGARFFGEVEGALAFAMMPKSIGGGFGQPFQLVLQYPDLPALSKTAEEIVGKLRASGWLANARSAFTYDKPQLAVRIDRDRAASLGVPISDVSKTLQILFGGLDLSTVKRGGKEYDVIVQLRRESRLTPADLERLYVRGMEGRLIQLSAIVNTDESAAPNAITRFRRLRSASIEGTPVGIPIGTAVKRAEALLRESLPAGFRYEWNGEAADLADTQHEGLFIAILAALIIYMVLAAQFESFVHPITVMTALPLGLVGAFGLLLLLGRVDKLGRMMYGWAHYSPDPPRIAEILSAVVPRIPSMNINLFSMVGIVLLFGMVTKNSILLVEFANQRMDAGADASTAMLAAGRIRLRPILMTMFSTVAGILPIAIGFGAGAEGRRPMGVAAVGGMLSSTVLTLFIVPVVYVLLDRLGRRWGGGRPVKAAALILLFALPARAADASAVPYTLGECLKTAMERNFEVRRAKRAIERQAGVRLAVLAAQAPSLDASGAFTKLDPNNRSELGGAKLGPTESWSAKAELTQPLFAGGKGSAAAKAESLRLRAAELAYESALADARLAARVGFYDVLRKSERIEVRRQAVELLERELEDAKRSRAAGAVSDFNVLRAEVALSNAQAPLIRARNDHRLALEELRRVMGLPSGAGRRPLEIAGELPAESAEQNLAEGLRGAAERRPELARLALLVDARKSGVRVVRADYLPEVDAQAAYEGRSDGFSSKLGKVIKGWRAGLSAEWNIFDSFGTTARKRSAVADLETARLALEEARQLVSVEVRTAHSLLVEAAELVAASEKVVEQAVESLRLAEARARADMATQLDVLQSQVSLTEARANRVEARFDLASALARYRRAAWISK